MIAWTAFVNPMTLSTGATFWMLLPLCVVVAAVYRAVRTEEIRRLGAEILALLGYMVVGLVAIAVVLWAIATYWP